MPASENIDTNVNLTSKSEVLDWSGRACRGFLPSFLAMSLGSGCWLNSAKTNETKTFPESPRLSRTLATGPECCRNSKSKKGCLKLAHSPPKS